MLQWFELPLFLLAMIVAYALGAEQTKVKIVKCVDRYSLAHYEVCMGLKDE